MNVSTILIGLVVAGLLMFAIRYLIKNGMCAVCENKSACQTAKKAASSGTPSECGGKCSSCKYHEAELKAAAEKHENGSALNIKVH
jgi:hypothetical protein